MCSSIVQTVFIIVLAVGFVITAVAFCTPGWRKIYYESANKTALAAAKDKDYSLGLISSFCGKSAKTSNIGKSCEDNFKNKPLWEQVVLASMVLAIVSQLIAMVWSCVVCYMCCCKSCLAPPLPILTGVSALLILIAVAVFAGKTGSFNEVLKPPEAYKDLKGKSSLGYSLWLAILAMLVMIADTIIGIVLCKTASVSPV